MIPEQHNWRISLQFSIVKAAHHRSLRTRIQDLPLYAGKGEAGVVALRGNL
jgi:hypothetical protein